MPQAMNKVQKDEIKEHLMSDSTSDSCFSAHGLMHKARKSSLFGLPGLFVGFSSSKGLSDADAVRSPTSPLDYKGFSNLGNSLICSSRSAKLDGSPKCWDCNKVGLSLVDILNDESKPGGEILGHSESKNILFSQRTRMNISSPKTNFVGLKDDSITAAPKSLPKDYGIYKLQVGSSRMSIQSKVDQSEIRDFGLLRSCSADITRCSCNPKSDSEVFQSELTSYSSQVVEGSGCFDKFSSNGVLSASEIEQSEDYTCIISYGPNPKTTHIFGDCILESHSFPSQDFTNKRRKGQESSSWLVKPFDDSLPCSPSVDFLSFCFSCKKRLEQENDIYIYRGEKAFCSTDCREQEILIEEETENPTTDSSNSSGSMSSSFPEDKFEGHSQDCIGFSALPHIQHVALRLL